jgi:hypothetical protein
MRRWARFSMMRSDSNDQQYQLTDRQKWPARRRRRRRRRVPWNIVHLHTDCVSTFRFPCGPGQLNTLYIVYVAGNEDEEGS